MATNDFLPFATGGGANVAGQFAYSADPNRNLGNQRGTAISSLTNKALRQATFPVSALSNLILTVLNEDVKDNGDIAAYQDQLRRALSVLTSTSLVVTNLVDRIGTLEARLAALEGQDSEGEL